MEVQVKSPSAGWSWLMRGIKTGFQHPKALFGAAVLLLVCTAVLVGLQMLGLNALGSSPGTRLAVMGVSMVVYAVIFSMLNGGFMCVMDAAKNGRKTRVLGLFDLFRTGNGGNRVAIFGICLMVIYVLALAVIYFTVGHRIGAWYMQVLAISTHHGKPPAMPPLPSGSGAAIGLLTVFYIFYSATYAIGIGQTALRAQTPLAALRDGVTGAFKNVLPLLILLISSLIAALVIVIAFAIVITVAIVLAAQVSQTVALFVIAPIYIAMALLMYVVMLGVMYAMWQDVTGNSQQDVGNALVTSVEA